MEVYVCDDGSHTRRGTGHQKTCYTSLSLPRLGHITEAAQSYYWKMLKLAVTSHAGGFMLVYHGGTIMMLSLCWPVLLYWHGSGTTVLIVRMQVLFSCTLYGDIFV